MFKLILIFHMAFTNGTAAVPIDGTEGLYVNWAQCQEAGNYTSQQSGDNLTIAYVCVPTYFGLKQGLK